MSIPRGKLKMNQRRGVKIVAQQNQQRPALPTSFNLERFQYEVANEIGIDLNELQSRDQRTIEQIEAATHSARSNARGGQGNISR